jgi:hypothetical protein
MTLGVVLELSLTFWQFFASLTSVPSFKVPDAWKEPMYYARIVNLDIPILREWMPALNDFRVYFTVICVIIPLCFIFFGLFFLNSVGVLLWYLLLLVGITMTVAAAAATFLQETLSLSVDQHYIDIVLYIGIALIVAMFIMFGCYAAYKHRQKQEQIEEGIELETVQDVMEAETKPFPVLATVQRFGLLLVIGIAGLVFLNFLFDFQLGSNLEKLQLGLGITFLILAALILIWTIAGCTLKGRQKQWKFFMFMEQQFMRLLLISMSMLYIPVGAGLFVLFNCNEQTCPVNQLFIREGSLLPYNNSMDVSISGRDVCIPCNMNSFQQCSARGSLCAGEARDRLEVDKFIDCDDLLIFNYAAFIVVAMYMIGVPLMFQQLVFRVTSLVLDQFPVKIPANVNQEDTEAIWGLKVVQSQNAARFLYQPFVPELRYARLYQLLQKLLVVFTAVFVIRVGIDPIYIALGASVVIHLISFGWLLGKKPFIHKFENGVATVMEIALLASAGAAICIFLEVDVPSWVLIVIIVVNGVIPLVAIIIGIALEWSSKKSREEQEREEQQAALEEEMARRIAEEEATENAIQQVNDYQANASPPQYYDGLTGMMSPIGVVTSNPNTPMSCEPLPSIPAENSFSSSLVKKPMSKEERLAQQRARALAAREAVLQRRRDEALELLSKQQDVDHMVDVDVKSRLNGFLMVFGLLGFIALGLCVVGHLAKKTTAPSTWEDSDMTTDVELGGYQSWQNFTQHCCCISNWGDSTKTTRRIVEQWHCDNGAVKERVRATMVRSAFTGDQLVQIDGLAIRGECAVEFNLGCILLTGGLVDTSDTSTLKTLAFCGSTVNTSGYALRYLW